MLEKFIMDQEPLLFRVHEEPNIATVPSKAFVQLPGEYRVKNAIYEAEIFEAADVVDLGTVRLVLRKPLFRRRTCLFTNKGKKVWLII